MSSEFEMRPTTDWKYLNTLCTSGVVRSFCAGLLMAILTVPRVASAAADDKPQLEPTAGSVPVPHGSIFVDPLGFALFGPRIGVEVGAKRVTGAVYGRWMNEGLLSHSLFLKSGDKFDFSYGAGVRGRYYLSDGMRATHLGLAFEYLRTSIETPSVLIVAKSAYVVPQLEVGYRVPFGRFYLDGSGALGYAFKASGNVDNLPGGNDALLYQASNESKIYGAASLEFGIYF